MISVHPAPREHLSWLAERAQLVVHPDLHAIEAVDETGRIVGMVGYDGWMPGAVCLHIAIEHPAALRRLLRPGFGVAFDPQPKGVGKVAALATVLSTNERSLKLVRHLGFREVYRGRDWSGPGVDFVVHEMRREECRFLPCARKAA